jgi:hydrogenase nickel incorporation protein HypB
MCEECGCSQKTGSKTGIHMHNHAHADAHSHSTQAAHSHTHEPAVILKNVPVEKSVTEQNDRLAHELSHELLHMDILCINVQGSPGSGKTSVIEGIARYIPPSKIAVIQGDLESDIDKKRLEKLKIATHQINTHSGCHLNAMMISDALRSINLRGKKYLIVENVGNLVCPAGVQIGQHMNMVVSSTTEGSDKPKKYPYIFMDANLIIISKIDIASAVGFNEAAYLTDLRNINGNAKILKTSTKLPESFSEVAYFLEHQREHLLEHGHSH